MNKKEFIMKGETTTFIEHEKPKSKILVGNLTIMNTKHFNWLNKLMFKIFFGIKIEDYKE